MANAQTPAQEAAERVAEIAPGLAAAAHATALREFAASQADYRQRVRDSHAAEMKTLGMSDVASQPMGDAMGNIIITGDISTPDPAGVIRSLSGQPAATRNTVSPAAEVAVQSPGPAAGQSSEPTTAPAKAAPTLAKWALPVALALGSGGVGAGATWLLTPKAAAPAAAAVQAAGEYVLELVPATNGANKQETKP